ncbi:hypothetical protein I8J29_16625 [Paenibacillus sp. MWE-103]|uniref:Exosporium protein C n=1 Tax=Paenibacillus artemisiicola TaxID=1172618 RepID=A0ABS3WBY5_9BACL|nr:hypothetical protein [Paenibacillus artemisiicola]MBO7745834.1 hypothetical protein [Paenibacillus artemisiicola]
MSVAFSTGVVTNTRAKGTAASTIVLNINNITSAGLTVIVKIFASVDSNIFYLATTSVLFIPIGAYEVRTFNIAGNVAYEFQVSVRHTSPVGPEALVSVYGIDEFGKLVNNQGFAPEELSVIPVFDV